VDYNHSVSDDGLKKSVPSILKPNISFKDTFKSSAALLIVLGIAFQNVSFLKMKEK